MYLQLIVSICAAIVLILLAMRYPVFATILYLLVLIYFVGFSTGRSSLGSVSIKFPLPFWRAIQSRHYGLTTNRSVLNVILFIPFGYLLSMLYQLYYLGLHGEDNGQGHMTEKEIKWWMVVCCGFLFSCLIETSQLIFRFGVFELDDLVKNTMGAVIGYVVWKGLNRRRQY